MARRIVEGEAGCAPELRVHILEAAAFELCLPLEDAFLCAGEDAIQAPEDREGEDDVLVLSALEGVADQVRDAPEEADDLAVVHVLFSIPVRCRSNATAKSLCATAHPLSLPKSTLAACQFRHWSDS